MLPLSPLSLCLSHSVSLCLSLCLSLSLRAFACLVGDCWLCALFSVIASACVAMEGTEETVAPPCLFLLKEKENRERLSSWLVTVCLCDLPNDFNTDCLTHSHLRAHGLLGHTHTIYRTTADVLPYYASLLIDCTH